jgi:hypothetical protein
MGDHDVLGKQTSLEGGALSSPASHRHHFTLEIIYVNEIHITLFPIRSPSARPDMFSEHVYCCVLSLLSHFSRHYFQPRVDMPRPAIFHIFCYSPLWIRFYHVLKAIWYTFSNYEKSDVIKIMFLFSHAGITAFILKLSRTYWKLNKVYNAAPSGK